MLKRHSDDEAQQIEPQSKPPLRSSRVDMTIFLGYILVSLSVLGLLYVKQLDGPDSFFQGWDNLHHLSAIQTFANTNVWNPLASGAYAPTDVMPYSSLSNGFYPSAWHILCASVISLLNVSPALSINCVNAILIGIVFPASVYGLLKTISQNNRFVVACGSIFSVGVAACPWDYVIYGPLYPNLMSMALIPAAMTTFILALQSINSKRFFSSLGYMGLTLASAVAVALAHANGIFTLVALLAPYLTYWVFSWIRSLGKPLVLRAIAALSIWVLVFAFWIVCYNLPSFRGIVGTTWPAISNFSQAIYDALMLAVVNRPAQPIVFCFVIFGIVYVARHTESRWLIASYVIAAIMYIVDAGTNSILKNWITGFWYTDYHRTDALLGLMAILLASFGAGSMIEHFVDSAIQGQGSHRVSTKSSATVMLGSLFLIFTLIFADSFSTEGAANPQTAFGYQAQEFSYQNDFKMVYYDVLTFEEQQFAEKALELVPDDSVLINNPNDGSCFLYSLYNRPMYYRICTTPSTNETEDSKLIRLHLSELATSSEVQEAVERIGAEYVIQLDSGERPEEFRINYNNYNPDEWVGIDSITPETPGFELVYSTEDMRLYRIVLP